MRYKWFVDLYEERKKTSDKYLEQEISLRLIAGFFCIYDWGNMKKEIERYLERNYLDSEKQKELLAETELVIKQMAKEIEANEEENIVIFVIDSLAKHVADEMPQLSTWKESAYEFENYKCIYPGTREIFNSLLTGTRPFRDTTFVGKKLTYSDGNLLEYVKNEGIELKLISEDYNVCLDYKDINQYKNIWEENALITEAFFSGICELLKSDKRQIIIIHTDITVHYPHYTPFSCYDREKNWECEEGLKEYKKCFINAINYTDEILASYSSMLDKNPRITQIVMGDHGIDIQKEFYSIVSPAKMPGDGAQWGRSVFDTELVIKSNVLGKGLYEEMVSSDQFYSILYALLRGCSVKENVEQKGVAPIEWVPGWDYNYIQRGLKVGNYYYCIGAAGCMNKEYMYMNTEDGEDLYYRIEKEKVQLLTEPDTIEKAKQSLGEENIEENRFPNEIMNHPRFETHKRAFAEYREAHKEQ